MRTILGNLIAQIKARSLRVPGFEQYFRRLHVHNNSRNVWFREYWQQKFGCSLPEFGHSYDENHRGNEQSRYCRPERESLTKVPYNEDPKLAFVINSILAVVHGLDKMHKQVWLIDRLSTHLVCRTRENLDLQWSQWSLHGHGSDEFLVAHALPQKQSIHWHNRQARAR